METTEEDEEEEKLPRISEKELEEYLLECAREEAYLKKEIDGGEEE